MRTGLVLACLVSLAVTAGSRPVWGQGAAFEVVSIKPNRSGDSGPTFRAGVGRFDAVNATLTEIVRSSYAFTFEDFQVVRGEGWFDSERFDIEARATGQPSAREVATTYVRAMLADRFKVKTHTEQREMPIFSITLARPDGTLGDGLRPSPAPCVTAPPEAVASGVRACGILIDDDKTGALHLDAHDTTLDLVARRLQFYVKRSVRNDTGLAGRYDVHARFAPPVVTGLESPFEAPALDRAFQEQLGLRLQARRAPLDVLVIDSATRPDAN